MYYGGPTDLADQSWSLNSSSSRASLVAQSFGRQRLLLLRFPRFDPSPMPYSISTKSETSVVSNADGVCDFGQIICCKLVFSTGSGTSR